MSIYSGPFRYGASHTAAVAGTFQDILSIRGSATANIHVTAMGVSAVQTADEFNLFTVWTRSNANTGGTSVAPALTPLNTNYPEASATVLFYTAPPTYGASPSTLWDGYVMCNDSTPASDVAGFSGVVINFVDLFGAPVDLIDAADTLGIGLANAAAPAGLTVAAWVSWYETIR